MPKDCCCEAIDHSKVKVSDGGNHAIFLNEGKEYFIRVRVDGCEITEGVRADWALIKDDKCILIELKGRDVEHASEQIFHTASYWKEHEPSVKLAGLIVARQFPRASSMLQIKMQKFVKKFGGPLHVVNHCPNLKFESVFRFSGIMKQ